MVNAVLHALQISLFMLWEVLWPLAFGFLLFELTAAHSLRQEAERFGSSPSSRSDCRSMS